MTKRIYDIKKMYNSGCHMVRLEEPINCKDNETEFNNRMDHVEQWIDSRCSGEYIILLHSIVFSSHKDATVFKLGYKYPKS